MACRVIPNGLKPQKKTLLQVPFTFIRRRRELLAEVADLGADAVVKGFVLRPRTSPIQVVRRIAPIQTAMGLLLKEMDIDCRT